VNYRARVYAPVVAWETSFKGTTNAGFSSTSNEREEPETNHIVV